ncbi:hypothetical protein D3C76_1213080 [compost metagenome]
MLHVQAGFQVVAGRHPLDQGVTAGHPAQFGELPGEVFFQVSGVDIQATGLDQGQQQRQQPVLFAFVATACGFACAIAGTLEIADQAQRRVGREPGRRWRIVVAVAAATFTLILDERAVWRVLGRARVVLEEQGAGVAIEVDVEHRHCPGLAIAGQPVAGGAHLHQQLVGLQQARALKTTLDKATQQLVFSRGEGAHQRDVFFDDSHGQSWPAFLCLPP